MKTNPTSTITTRLQALGLVAAILSPGMVLAKPASTTASNSPQVELLKPRTEQKPRTSTGNASLRVRFNTIDGDPIK